MGELVYVADIVTTQEIFELMKEEIPRVPWSFYPAQYMKRSPISTTGGSVFVGNCYCTRYAEWSEYQIRLIIKEIQKFAIKVNDVVVSIHSPDKGEIVISVIPVNIINKDKELEYDI